MHPAASINTSYQTPFLPGTKCWWSSSKAANAVTMVYAKVNEEYVPIDYELQNKDRVQIITDPLSYGPKPAWEEKAKTTKAKRLIK